MDIDMDIEPNIPLIAGKKYEFYYDNKHNILQFSHRDEEGLHFDEYNADDDITWDIIIPPNRILDVTFEEEFEGHTDTEEQEEHHGGINRKRKSSRKRRKVKSRVKRRKSRVKTRKSKVRGRK